MKKGSALLLMVMISAVLMVLAVFLLKMIYNCHGSVAELVAREKSFWLAEAGIEDAKFRLKKNPNWYTDLPHYPENDVRWLSGVAFGEQLALGEGTYKIVREKDKFKFYAVGRSGAGMVILSYDVAANVWKEI
ncbi:MAG: hypothetical protein PHH14_07615 [Candidatus Margulisbacteria bacterium]|nr:hypothetical protein [Candidatus Margulisiibacteriota bacterium]